MKTISYYITLSIILSGLVLNSNAQKTRWLKVESPVSAHLRNLAYADSLTVWAAGAAGTIIKTTNGGLNWEIQNSNVTSFIMDIFFLNKNLGWAVTIKDVPPFNTQILKTSDGGENWIIENYPDGNAFMTTIYFLDSLTGFMGGTYIAKTSNGGITWARMNVDSTLVSNYPVYKFNFYNKSLGYATGGFIDQAGVIWRTSDGGENRTSHGLSPDEIFDIHIKDSLNAIALSGDPEGFYSTGLITTTDAGLTWEYEELPVYLLSLALDFRTVSEGWSASGYRFLKTTDGGINWFIEDVPENVTVYDLEFTDRYHGYAVGESGNILVYIPDPLNINEEEAVPDDFLLYQNYPNPFNPSTEIKFYLPYDSYVSLSIYNSLGEKISQLINNELKSGEYRISFSENDLSSGVYFYMLRAESNNSKNLFSDTKKMILIR